MSGQQRSEVERKRARVNVCRETRDAVRERARRREVVRAGGAAGSESKGKKKNRRQSRGLLVRVMGCTARERKGSHRIAVEIGHARRRCVQV
jgi:hypothetical protein